MKTYYHVTRTKNLESIMQSGLLPKIGRLSKILGEKEVRIYLFPSTDDMNTALSSWLGENLEEEFGEDEEFCSLKISLPDNFPIKEGEVEYECYSYKTINPEYIEYLKKE